MTQSPRTTGLAAGVLTALLVLGAGCVNVNPLPTPTREPTATPSPTPLPSATQPATPTSTSARSPTPTASGSPASNAPESPLPSIDPALGAQIDAVTAQVPPIRELESTTDVPYGFISREQFRDDLIELADEDVPPEVRAAEERLLKRLGLVPEDADLEALLLELYGAQVAAYYRPDTGRFYIIERDQPFGPVDRLIVAHEYTHALQDQHFDLEGTRISDPAEGDGALAQLAVIEGDATLASQLWASENLTFEEMIEMLGESLAGLDEQSLAGMPLVLRRQLEYPYIEGFLFVNDIYTQGGFDAVNEAIRTPPASTEQILHPEKYHDREAPIDVVLEDDSPVLNEGNDVWSLTYQQTIGELGIQIFATGGEEPDVAIPGLPVDWPHAEVAAGWGGDRLHMYEGPNGAWIIDWQTAWDTQTDADEFAARVTELQGMFDGPTLVVDPPEQRVRVVIASDQQALNLLPG